MAEVALYFRRESLNLQLTRKGYCKKYFEVLRENRRLFRMNRRLSICLGLVTVTLCAIGVIFS